MIKTAYMQEANLKKRIIMTIETAYIWGVITRKILMIIKGQQRIMLTKISF